MASWGPSCGTSTLDAVAVPASARFSSPVASGTVTGTVAASGGAVPVSKATTTA